VSNFDFLIVGAGRGGTSLLTGVLDSHPNVVVSFEKFAIDCLMRLGLQMPAGEIKPTLAQTRSAEFRDQCEREARKQTGKKWGNKITTE